MYIKYKNETFDDMKQNNKLVEHNIISTIVRLDFINQHCLIKDSF